MSRKQDLRFQITKDEALMGGYWFVLTDAKTGKVWLEAHSKSPIAPEHIRRYQATLNTKYHLDIRGAI